MGGWQGRLEGGGGTLSTSSLGYRLPCRLPWLSASFSHFRPTRGARGAFILGVNWHQGPWKILRSTFGTQPPLALADWWLISQVARSTVVRWQANADQPKQP